MEKTNYKFPQRAPEYEVLVNEGLGEMAMIIATCDFLGSTMQNYDNALFCKVVDRLKVRAQEVVDSFGIGAKG